MDRDGLMFFMLKLKWSRLLQSTVLIGPLKTPGGQKISNPFINPEKHNLQRPDCKCEGTVNRSKISRQRHPLLTRQSGVSQAYESTGAA